MIVTRKNSVWKCLVLLYELDFNVRNTVMSNTNVAEAIAVKWEGTV